VTASHGLRTRRSSTSSKRVFPLSRSADTIRGYGVVIAASKAVGVRDPQRQEIGRSGLVEDDKAAHEHHDLV
jgi:hypothetical protein